MKKKFYWLFLLILPVVFVAATTAPNDDGNDTGNCSQWGEKHQNYNGNQGCPYSFDFNDYVNQNCTLTDIDLDINTSGIQHYYSDQTVELWTNGSDGIIVLLPKEGYGGPGFVKTCDVDLYFQSNAVEYAKWTCVIDDYPGPYPDPCY